jgi:hypothetical protein
MVMFAVDIKAVFQIVKKRKTNQGTDEMPDLPCNTTQFKTARTIYNGAVKVEPNWSIFALFAIILAFCT